MNMALKIFKNSRYVHIECGEDYDTDEVRNYDVEIRKTNNGKFLVTEDYMYYYEGIEEERYVSMDYFFETEEEVIICLKKQMAKLLDDEYTKKEIDLIMKGLSSL